MATTLLLSKRCKDSDFHAPLVIVAAIDEFCRTMPVDPSVTTIHSPRVLFSRVAEHSYWVIVALFVVRMVERHITAGFTLPVPWPDESSFLWQAISFQRSNTLFAPELNAAREVMWMPPGYMICIGLLFKITGASLAVARWASFVFIASSFVLLAAILRRAPYAIVAIILLGIAMLSAPVIVIANTARMDALLLLVSILAITAFSVRRDGLGMSIVVLSPLIHPNGLYLCAAAVLYVIVERRWKKFHLRWNDILPVIITLVFWGAYVWHVAGHWNDFRYDMAFQFLLKSAKSLPLYNPANIIFLALFAITVALGLMKKQVDPLLVCFCLGWWAIFGMGIEAWYEAFFVTAFALMVWIVLSIVLRFPSIWFTGSRRRIGRNAIIITAVLVVCLVALRTLVYQNSQSSMGSAGWYGMRIQDADVPYISDSDIDHVRHYLTNLQASPTPVLIQFLPVSDALFFIDQEAGSVRFCQGTFYSFTPAVYLLHTSRYIAPWWSNEMKRQLSAMGIRAESRELLCARDSTESFRLCRYVQP